MRGKDNFSIGQHEYQGITPAYAGKSCVFAAAEWAQWDHPRVCGEKSALGAGSAGGVGSPPRMRGKDADTSYPAVMKRITPAYAGKSLPCARGRGIAGDHPRVCGEKCKKWEADGAYEGSPPRMRGKVS